HAQDISDPAVWLQDEQAAMHSHDTMTARLQDHAGRGLRLPVSASIPYPGLPIGFPGRHVDDLSDIEIDVGIATGISTRFEYTRAPQDKRARHQDDGTHDQLQREGKPEGLRKPSRHARCCQKQQVKGTAEDLANQRQCGQSEPVPHGGSPSACTHQASFCQVSTTVSGLSDIDRMPWSRSQIAKSGWSLG